MKASVIAPVLLGIFIFIAVFGMPVLLLSPEHAFHCPLMGADMVLCDRTLAAHEALWSALFVTVVNVLAALAACAVVSKTIRLLLAHKRLRPQYAFVSNDRPTLMQELFSRGILNRKEPSF